MRVLATTVALFCVADSVSGFTSASVSFTSSKHPLILNRPASTTHGLHFRSNAFPKLHDSHAPYGTSLFFTNTETLLPGISAINTYNEELDDMLTSLREQPYFRLYSVDMLGSCEYMPQELFECYSSTCEIYPVDDDEVGLCEL